MRRHGIEQPYEKLKVLTRGHRISRADLSRFIDSLELPDDVKTRLKALKPGSYVGNAPEQAKAV